MVTDYYKQETCRIPYGVSAMDLNAFGAFLGEMVRFMVEIPGVSDI